MEVLRPTKGKVLLLVLFGSFNIALFMYTTTTTMPMPNICRGGIERTIELVIAVPIARNNSEGRQTIRETWGSFGTAKSSSTPLVFFIGSGEPTEDPGVQETINAESNKHQDMIQKDFVDTYDNLTLKSLSILHWVTKNCDQSSYLLKADDDMYINIPLLLSTLKNTTKSQKGKPFILGWSFNGVRPIRNRQNKWFTSLEHFKESVYPRYVSGTAYSMTMSAAVALFNASSHVPFFWLEDIYITGLCSRQAKVPIVNTPLLTYDKPTPSGDVFKHRISGHRYTLKEIRKIHKELYPKGQLLNHKS